MKASHRRQHADNIDLHRRRMPHIGRLLANPCNDLSVALPETSTVLKMCVVSLCGKEFLLRDFVLVDGEGVHQWRTKYSYSTWQPWCSSLEVVIYTCLVPCFHFDLENQNSTRSRKVLRIEEFVGICKSTTVQWLHVRFVFVVFGYFIVSQAFLWFHMAEYGMRFWRAAMWTWGAKTIMF